MSYWASKRSRRVSGVVDPLPFVLERLALAPRRWRIDVLLETTLEAAQAQLVPGTALLEPVDGGVRFRSTADSLESAARLLAGLGCPLTVREPAELCAALQQLATTLLAAASAFEQVGRCASSSP